MAGGESYGLGPRWKRRWTERVPRVRSVFEGMEPAIAQAAAAARAAEPARTAEEEAASRRAAFRSKIYGTCYLCGAGLRSLAVAAVVQPQAAGWVMHSAAWALRIFCVAAGGVFMLVGAGLVLGARRDQRTADQ